MGLMRVNDCLQQGWGESRSQFSYCGFDDLGSIYCRMMNVKFLLSNGMATPSPNTFSCRSRGGLEQNAFLEMSLVGGVTGRMGIMGNHDDGLL